MLLIANPRAGGLSTRRRDDAVRELRRGWEVEVVETEGRGHGSALCVQAIDQDFDLAVALGGDGTANEVVNGLMRASADTAFAALPAGTTNVISKQLGAPANLDAAVARLRLRPEARPVRAIDLGLLNDRYFVISAGMGIDATVVRDVEMRPRTKARLGAWYYTYVGVRGMVGAYAGDPPHLEISTGLRNLRGVSAFFQNGPRYTYFRNRAVDLAAGRALDDGCLAGAILGRARARDAPGLMWRALSRRQRVAAHAHVEAFNDACSIEVLSAGGRQVPTHVDGEFIGELQDATLRVQPRALRVFG